MAGPTPLVRTSWGVRGQIGIGTSLAPASTRCGRACSSAAPTSWWPTSARNIVSGTLPRTPVPRLRLVSPCCWCGRRSTSTP